MNVRDYFFDNVSDQQRDVSYSGDMEEAEEEKRKRVSRAKVSGEEMIIIIRRRRRRRGSEDDALKSFIPSIVIRGVKGREVRFFRWIEVKISRVKGSIDRRDIRCRHCTFFKCFPMKPVKPSI